MRILVGLTTTRSDRIPDYLRSIRRLGLTEIALFPTALDFRGRQDLYRELEDSPVQSIPHVHLRTDMAESELDYLVDRFQTRVFNIHSLRSNHPYQPRSDRYLKRIFIENSGVIPGRDELALFGGLCLDFSHWENGRLTRAPEYVGFERLVEEFPIGCCHVSAIHSAPVSPWGSYDDHEFHHLGEFQYLRAYRRFLPEYVSLELENSLEDQLRVKAALEEILQIVSDGC